MITPAQRRRIMYAVMDRSVTGVLDGTPRTVPLVEQFAASGVLTPDEYTTLTAAIDRYLALWMLPSMGDDDPEAGTALLALLACLREMTVTQP